MTVSAFAHLSARARRALQAVLLGSVLLAPLARADLMLYPTRLVFEKNQRAAQIELINNGTEPATYRLSLVNRRMSENGQFQPAEPAAPGELFAEPMLRFSPRQVTLQPGTSQTVRVMLRKPAELADGEYRSHLQFDKLAEVQGSNSVENQAEPGAGIGVVLTALVGASVPVIVRHGATSASVALSHLALSGPPTAPVLAMQFARSGNASVYGDLSVTFTPQGGAAQQIGKMAGIAVYAPNASRLAQLPLQPPPALALAHGTLSVTYHARPDAGGALLAQASLPLP
ncbi:MAG TPA: fimbria/pilus periplasmic chaperone [Telluria sp.]|nr:fimbria/pilus periplasmic chaperone [Telluria sp.]